MGFYDPSELENKRIRADAFKERPFFYVLNELVQALALVVIVLLMAQCACEGCIL